MLNFCENLSIDTFTSNCITHSASVMIKECINVWLKIDFPSSVCLDEYHMLNIHIHSRMFINNVLRENMQSLLYLIKDRYVRWINIYFFQKALGMSMYACVQIITVYISVFNVKKKHDVGPYTCSGYKMILIWRALAQPNRSRENNESLFFFNVE